MLKPKNDKYSVFTPEFPSHQGGNPCRKLLSKKQIDEIFNKLLPFKKIFLT